MGQAPSYFFGANDRRRRELVTTLIELMPSARADHQAANTTASVTSVRELLIGPVYSIVQGLSIPSRARLSRIELPMTDSELTVIAMTPIMGWSSPDAAIGIAARL